MAVEETYLKIFNGAKWLKLDVKPPSGLSSYAAIAKRGEDLYFGYGVTGAATVSYSQTLMNGGTRLVYPVVRVKATSGTAVLEWMRNETTGKTLWFNYTIQEGEELTIDLRPTQRTISSAYYGAVWRGLTRGSDFASWYLLPGANVVTFVATGTISAYMSWREVYWSADGAAV